MHALASVHNSNAAASAVGSAISAVHKTKLAMRTQHGPGGRHPRSSSRNLRSVKTATEARPTTTTPRSSAQPKRNFSAPAAVSAAAQPVAESDEQAASPAEVPDASHADGAAPPKIPTAPKLGTVVPAQDVPDGVYSLGKRDLLRQAWHQVRTALPDGPFVALERVAFIDALETDTQVWLSVNRTAKQVRLGELSDLATGACGVRSCVRCMCTCTATRDEVTRSNTIALRDQLSTCHAGSGGVSGHAADPEQRHIDQLRYPPIRSPACSRGFHNRHAANQRARRKLIRCRRRDRVSTSAVMLEQMHMWRKSARRINAPRLPQKRGLDPSQGRGAARHVHWLRPELARVHHWALAGCCASDSVRV